MPKGIHSVLSSHPLFSQFRGPFPVNMADDGTGGGNADGDQGKGDQGKGDDGNNGQKKDDQKKPDDTEGRISQLAKENKELREWKKEQERLKKEAEDAKLQEAGEHQKLAEQYKNESATEKAAREAAENRAKKFEELMEKQIADQLKAITDTDKQKKITELLKDKPVEEQMEMLPNLLGLMGVAPASFGGPTPTSTTTPDKTDEAVKQKRFDELLVKATSGTLTHQERMEKDKLARELSSFFKS